MTVSGRTLIGPIRLHSWRAWLAALCIAWLCALPATAQTRPPPVPAVLTDVAVMEVGPDETHLLLTFAPAAPSFSVIVPDSERPAIGFALSSRGQSARTPFGPKGLLRTIDFEQQDSVLILRPLATSRVKMSATAVSDKVISVTLTATHASSASTATGAQPPGPLPKAVDPPPGDDNFEVVPLKYADVSEVVGLLTDGLTVKPNDSFTPREPAFGSAGMNSAQYTAPPPPPDASDQPIGQSVDDAIAIDRRLNAVILKGPPERIARLKAKIAEIDVPLQSVILETVFVELTDNGAKNVGFDFNNANGQLGVATFQAGSFIPPGFPSDRILTSGQLQAALYAEVQAGHGRIVSKPRIAAQSGSSAKIITGDALPILTAITLSGVNGVSQQVQYVNVGVTLQIAPRVSSDGFVTSHIFCVVSSVTGYSQGYPTISQRQAETTATVRDGETFVIGGLTVENELATNQKLPLAGDIPIAGELFKLHKGSHSDGELYIVVTPHVVKRGESVALPPDVESAPPR
jgi:general secretion pathway protein D